MIISLWRPSYSQYSFSIKNIFRISNVNQIKLHDLLTISLVNGVALPQKCVCVSYWQSPIIYTGVCLTYCISSLDLICEKVLELISSENYHFSPATRPANRRRAKARSPMVTWPGAASLAFYTWLLFSFSFELIFCFHNRNNWECFNYVMNIIHTLKYYSKKNWMSDITILHCNFSLSSSIF